MENSFSSHIGCYCHTNDHVNATLFVSRSCVEVSYRGGKHLTGLLGTQLGRNWLGSVGHEIAA